VTEKKKKIRERDRVCVCVRGVIFFLPAHFLDVIYL